MAENDALQEIIEFQADNVKQDEQIFSTSDNDAYKNGKSQDESLNILNL